MADPLLEEDLRFWCNHSRWDIDMAVGLACGHDPAKFNPAYVHRAMPAPELLAYKNLHSLVSRAIECEELPALMTPQEFLRWADKRAVEIRTDLRDTITRHYVKARDERDAHIRALTNRHNTYMRVFSLVLRLFYDKTRDQSSASIAKKLLNDAQLQGLDCPAIETLKKMVEESNEYAAELAHRRS